MTVLLTRHRLRIWKCTVQVVDRLTTRALLLPEFLRSSRTSASPSALAVCCGVTLKRGAIGAPCEPAASICACMTVKRLFSGLAVSAGSCGCFTSVQLLVGDPGLLM